MADDLDDELFSLAAGRNKAPSKKRNRKNSDSDEEGMIESDGEYEEAPRKKKSSKASGSRRGRNDDVDDDDFDDDQEGLYEDEEDRRRLMALNELQREMILAERAEARDKERQRKQLLQQRAVADKADARRQERDEGGKAKGPPRSRAARTSQAARTSRDWSDNEVSEGGLKSSDEEEEEFQPSMEGSSSDEEDGQAGRREEEAREEEEAAEAQRGPERPPPPPPPPPVAPAAAAVYAGEEDEERHAARARERERERVRGRHSDDEEAPEEASLEELLTCQVTRSQLEDWFGQPFFERDALNGCVVRMAYGPGTRDNAGNAHPGYMIMEITDIRESGRSYKFGSKGEATSKHLALRDGLGITRVMAMANVSSKPFDEAEYERYKRHCVRASRAPITREEAATAAKRVAASANYRWTSADLKAELERKRASRAAPVNPAAEKAMLKRRLEMAAGAGNVDEVAALEEQLAALDAHLLTATSNARAFGMMDINKRNKQHNLTVAYKTTAAEEHGGADGHNTDVFSRRATTLNIYWKTGAGKKDEPGAEVGQSAGAVAVAKAQSVVPGKLTTAQQRMDPVDLLRQLGVDVDLSLLRGAPIAPSLAARLLPPKWKPAALARHNVDLGGKSVLTIADWKRRAGDY